MKLWLLQPIELLTTLWNPWYDKVFGFVVRAENETEARKAAAAKAGDETPEAWLNSHHSTCVELLPDGKPGVLLTDHRSG